MTAESPSRTLHPLHRLWRTLPQGARRSALAKGATWLAPRPSQPPPPVRDGVIVAGEIGRASGLGEAARITLRGLAHLGVPAWPLRAGLSVPGEDADLEVAPPAAIARGAALLIFVNAPLLPAALWRLGREFVSGRRIIGHWAWELPVVPDTWRAGVDFVHEIWAPSRFTAAALDAIAPGRVRVVPYPIAVAPPMPAAIDRAGFGLPADAVIVLTSFNLASSFARKNPLAAIEAFRHAFGARRDRHLVIKITNQHHFPLDAETLRAAIGDAANITLETRVFSAGETHALTACSDIVLSLHRSEGFGLVPAEAMLLGKPVIATDFSGNTDFMDESCAIPVPYRLIPAVDPRGVFEAPGAAWAEPDASAAAKALVRLADDTDLRTRIGATAREMAAQRLGTGPLVAALAGLGLAIP